MLLVLVTFAQTQTISDVASWRYGADRGDAVAQFWLGAAYESGKGVEKDFGKALRWLSESARQGNADALNLLGIMYEFGEGVYQNYRKAAVWYRAACEQRPDYGGAGQGCANLGLLYLEGHGVEQNSVQAYKYLTLGRNGSDVAVLKSKMSFPEISDAEREIKEWLQTHPDK